MRRLSFMAAAAAFVGVASFASGAPLSAPIEKGQTQAVDRFGDPLPPFAVARLGSVRWRQPLRNGFGFKTAALAPGGNHLYSLGHENFILWDVATGRAVPWSLKVKTVSAAAFSADGMTIVTAETQEKRDVDGVGNGRTSLVSLRRRDVVSGRIHRTIEFERTRSSSSYRFDHFDFQRGILVSLDGDEKLAAWDLDKGTIRWTSKEGFDASTRFHVSPDGAKAASVGADRVIEVYDMATGKQLQRLDSLHPDQADASWIHLRFSADGHQLFVVGLGARMQTVDLASARIVGETDPAKIPDAVSQDGTRMVRVKDGRLLLYDAKADRFIRTFDQGSSSIQSASFSADGSRIVTGEDFTVGLWDTATGKRLNPLLDHRGPLRSLAFSPDGTRIATGAEDEHVLLWQVDGAKILQRFPGHSPAVHSLAFRPDGRVLAAGEGAFGTGNHFAEVRLWNIDDGQMLKSFPAHMNAVHSIRFAADGKTLYTAGSDIRIRIWDPATGVRLEQIRFASCFAVRPGERSLVAIDGTSSEGLILNSWTAGMLKRIGPLDRTMLINPCGIAFCDQGKVAISICEDLERMNAARFPRPFAFFFWNAATGTLLRTIPMSELTDSAEPTTWSVSPDGTLAVIAEGSLLSPTRLRLFDLVVERELIHWRGHTSSLQTLIFSPDGKRLATASGDATVLVWDLPSARLLGLWPRIGDDERTAQAVAANLDSAAPFLMERIKSAIEFERVFARWIGDLGSEEPASIDRARQRLVADDSAEFALRLAIATHPQAAVREHAAKVLAKLTASRPDDVDRIATLIGARERPFTFADLKSLGPAAEATFREARDRVLKMRRRSPPVPDPFLDQAYLAGRLPPASVLRSIRMLAASGNSEVAAFMQELARGPKDSRLAQEARSALADRKR